MKNYSILLSLSLISTLINANFTRVSSFHAPSNEQIELYHNENGFHIACEGETKPVQNCWVDPVLRNISNEKLHLFQQAGYIIATKMTDGEFNLKARVRGNGGGIGGANVGF